MQSPSGSATPEYCMSTHVLGVGPHNALGLLPAVPNCLLQGTPACTAHLGLYTHGYACTQQRPQATARIHHLQCSALYLEPTYTDLTSPAMAVPSACSPMQQAQGKPLGSTGPASNVNGGCCSPRLAAQEWDDMLTMHTQVYAATTKRYTTGRYATANKQQHSMHNYPAPQG